MSAVDDELVRLKKNPLLFYISKNKRSFSLGMFFLLITNSLDGVYPLILKSVIDEVTNHATVNIIRNSSLMFLLVMSMLALTRYLWRVNFGRYHTHAAEDLRTRIFFHLTNMGPTFFKKNPIGELLSLIINDVQAFRTAIGSGVLVFLDGLIITAVVLPLMVWLNPSWTWKTLILLPLVPFIIKRLTQLIFSASKTQQDKLAELSGVAQEIVSGIRVIKSFAQEQNQLDSFNAFSRRYETASNLNARWDSVFMPVMEFGVASGSVILLFVGGHDVLAGAATIGTFVAFQRYITKMVWPMTALGLGFSQYQKGMASFARIRGLLDQNTDIPDSGTEELQGIQSLQVKNLSFKYPDGNSYALENLNFTVSESELVGIVGPVGSGKTTLLHLISRLFPADKGAILLNGRDISDFKKSSLYKNMVMVPQEAFLFSEKISENMSYGLQSVATPPELDYWSDSVDMKDEIKSLPHAFDSQLGERGVNLSGGQKQRLTISRALITEAAMVILDDSLSAVDVNTEGRIAGSLAGKEVKKQTRIIVAHRLSSVEKADKIIVLKDGRIEAIGRHEELLKSSPTYQAMAQIQGRDQ